MIYQPRNVQPSGSSIDGNINNTFTMEVQTNSYVSAYQLLIVDFNNNNIYTGTKTTLTQNLYNGDILSIPVNASSVKLSNGTNYKWRVRLYQPNSDMLITYGLVQSTSTTTNVYLQPNINIKAGMTLTINSQSKTITSYDVSTGLAVVSNAFLSAPSVGAQYQVYSDFIETIPDYIVYARENPTVSINNVPTSLTLKYHTFQGVYTQSDNVPIVYHQFDLYIRNDNGTNTLVNSSGKVYSANLSYTYDGFRTGNTYLIKLTVENDMGVIVDTDLYTFNVSYDIVEYLQQPLATFNNKNNAVQVSWVTPVENEATSFRSDAARGIVQSNDNTLTSVYLEPGQSISDGDVVQVTNSDYSLVLDGKSTQETRSGKNLFDSEFRQGSNTSATLSNYIFSKNIINCEKKNTYIFSTNLDTTVYKYAIQTNTQEFPTYNAVSDNTGWQTTSTTKIETSIDGYLGILITKISGTDITPDEIKNVKFQIEKGSVATSYEPYGVMPSPNYPSEVKNIKGSNYININATPIQLAASKVQSIVNNSITIAATNTGNWQYVKFPIDNWEKLLNKTIIFKVNSITPSSSNKGRALLAFADNSNNMLSIIGQLDTAGTAYFTIGAAPEGATKMTLTLYANTTGTANIGDTVSYNELQLSTNDCDYVPYNNIQIKDVGKNLFNTVFEQNARNNTDGKTTVYSTNYIRTKNPIQVEPNITYTIKSVTSKKISGGDIHYYDKNMNFIGRDEIALESVKTMPNGCYYINFQYYSGAGIVPEDIKTTQLEKGSTATSYEPYQSQTLNIDLQGNELCSNGNVKDELVVENGRAKIIKRLGESKNNIVSDATNTYTNIKYFQIAKPTDYKNYAEYVMDYNLLFTHASATGSVKNWDSAENIGKIISGSSRNYFWIGFPLGTTLEQARELLSNNCLYYTLAKSYEIDLGEVGTLKPITGVNNMNINTSLNTTFSLVYPYKTITGDTWGYTTFNPAGVKQTGIINYYDTAIGLGTFSSKQSLTYVPMKGDAYEVISNIYNTSGFLYLYDTPYDTVNSLYTHGYTAAWSASDGLCILPDDFNITLQFSPDSGFFYDENGAYKERVILVDTEVDGDGNSGRFQIIIDKNKIIFTQQPGISLESGFYTDKTQTFVLTDTGVVQINSDYIWDDTATWNDNYIWTEGGTSIERVCNHWWRVQITNTSIRVEEIFPT